jgi:DNA-binding SARP family transcriptional activator/class 3 adenylate cyclase
VRFAILGPLEVTDDEGRRLGLAAYKQRTVLAILLLHANEVVSSDRLVEDVWGEERPPSAVKALQVHVSRLRGVVGGAGVRGAGRLATAGGGYVLRLAPGELDAEVFEQLIEEGGRLIAENAWEPAIETFSRALELWRGPPLSDFAYESFAQAEIARLSELHVGAVERRIAAQLAIGRDAEVIGDLERLVREHPYRERFRAQLMLALYRTGRQAEALAAYREARAVLVDELGIEPSPELRDLHEAILAQDKSLLGPASQRDQVAPEKAPTRAVCEPPRCEVAPAPREERKVVTVLFAELISSMDPAERRDPEDVRALLAPHHRRVRVELERFGATVEKFIGDAVMAAFGAPFAHEDDAERAVRAGLEILEAIAELNVNDPALDLQMRVGINTGEALVAIGSRFDEGEGVVSGDVVNTAARIQIAAPVNAVVVSEQTYRATNRVFDYEPLPGVGSEGKPAPRPLWCAKAARARYGSDVRREFRTPFVGRELEKPFLIASFERAAQQRSVQLLTIVGEPGVGKSRLVAELFSYVHGKSELNRWRQGRCLPYGDGITFWALGEIVKAEAGILESDAPQAALEKLGRSIPPADGDQQWLLQRLAPLVGAELGAPAERQELFTAWRRWIDGLAAARPTILVFDDLHWADDALLSFLEHLAEWSHDVPLLLLCTARPELYERRPTWGAGLRNEQTINLAPLSDAETAELVSHLSRSTELSAHFERLVLDRAGGNPLYTEELVRFLVDRQLDPSSDALDDTALPDTVQALIAARLDTLEFERKSLLQDAAVVGTVFWIGALTEIGGGSDDELEGALHELTLKELVRPARTSSMEGEREYAFWHILVRDVAYSQIPRAQRARRHRSAAAWIERKAGERVEDLAEVLAHHYLTALELAGELAEGEELAAPARRFLALAGERALGLDTTQAESRLARALELTPAGPERAVVLIRWAEAAYQAGRLGDAAEALDEVLESLRGSRETETTARALQLRSHLAQRLGEGHQVALAAEAVTLLERGAPTPALVDARAELARAHVIAGEYDQGIAVANRACRLAETLTLPEPARALAYRGYARANLGDEDGLAEMKRALSRFMDAGAGQEAAFVQNNLAIAAYPLQGPARSLAAFDEGIAFCEQRGLADAAAFLGVNCPGLLTELGRPEEAIERAAALTAALEGSGNAQEPCELRAIELAVRLACGERVAAEDIDFLITTARTIQSPEVSGLALSVAAAALTAEAPERSLQLLTELQQVPSVRETPYYGRQLPGIIRTALAAGDPVLAKHVVEGIHPRYPLEEHTLCTGRAQLAEAVDEHAEAARLYSEAGERWHAFGNVPERAYALLGRGRCLVALGDTCAEEPLLEAHDLFGSMGYNPALAETTALLEKITAPQP